MTRFLILGFETENCLYAPSFRTIITLVFNLVTGNQSLSTDNIITDIISPIMRQYTGVRMVIGLPSSHREARIKYEHVDLFYYDQR